MLQVTQMTQFCSRDLITVEISVAEDRIARKLIVASEYMPYEENEPPILGDEGAGRDLWRRG